MNAWSPSGIGPVPGGPVEPGRATRKVLLVLLTDAANLSSHPVSRLAGVRSAEVFRILRRLESEGWARAGWGPGEPGRQQRLYRLTPLGRAGAMKMLGLEERDE